MIDFSQPQRQSSIGVLVMFADTARHFVRAFWPILVVWVFNRHTLSFAVVLPALVVFFLALCVGAYLRWRNFTFYLDGEHQEFIISEGVFNKSKTVIALDKIQQVNIKQSLIQRIIKVHGLEIDTAGSQTEEAKIKAVSHDLAIALKTRLLQNERKKAVLGDNSWEETAEISQKPFLRISLASLVKVGITSNYMKTFWLIFVFIVTLYDNLRQMIHGEVIDREQIDQYVTDSISFNSIAALVAMIIVLILLINLTRTVVKYYGYKITKQSGSLMLTFGLISLKNTIIKPEKVQLVALTRNYFQKKMNILGIKISQANSGQNEQKGHNIEIPGCDEEERDELLKLLFNIVPEKGAMLKPNYRKLVFSIFLSIVLPLSVFYSIAGFGAPQLYQYAFLGWIYAALLLMVHCFGFRNYRIFIGPRFIIKQSGAWDITNEIVEPSKIQAIRTSQLFWHKRADIGYLTLYTAGGSISFALGNFTAIKNYVNLWLYEMESSDVNWM